MDSKSIYISYSHKDNDKVAPILKELNRLDVDYWFDEHIETGELWIDTIEDALNEASVYVLLMSPDFISSEWSMYELGHAITAFKRTGAILVPVIIKEVSMPAFLRNIHYLDATCLTPKEIAKRIRDIVKQNK